MRLVIGLRATEKAKVVRESMPVGCVRVVVLGPRRFDFELDAQSQDVEFVDWPHVIEYKFFYRLLQQVDARTLVVVNEPLRTGARNDLTYNCVRHILAQAGAVVVFSWLPIISEPDDFMVLYDFATGSRYRRLRLNEVNLRECDLEYHGSLPDLTRATTEATPALEAAYKRARDSAFAGLGAASDPHNVPRRLHLLGGLARSALATAGGWLVRNARLPRGEARWVKYADAAAGVSLCGVVDVAHRHVEMCDALAASSVKSLTVATTTLKVDTFYWLRLAEWRQKMEATLDSVL